LELIPAESVPFAAAEVVDEHLFYGFVVGHQDVADGVAADEVTDFFGEVLGVVAGAFERLGPDHESEERGSTRLLAAALLLLLPGSLALCLLVFLHCFTLLPGISVYCFSLLFGSLAGLLAIFSDTAIFPLGSCGDRPGNAGGDE